MWDTTIIYYRAGRQYRIERDNCPAGEVGFTMAPNESVLFVPSISFEEAGEWG